MSEERSEEQKVWDAARYYAGAFGSVPNSFSTTIRSLISDHQANPNEYSNAGRFLAGRLVRSPSMQVRLQYAIATYKPEVALAGEPSPAEYLKVLKPYDLAALFGTIYSYRKFRKRCDAQEFSILSKIIQEAADVGGLLGLAIPKIGFACGLLAGAFSIMSICPMMLQDIKAFKEYKRKTKPKGFRYNLQFELETFQTTHAHICSWIIPPLGYGVQLARPMTEGFLGELSGIAPVDAEAYKFYITMIWIESLLKTGNPPEIVHKGGYYPVKTDMDKLLAAVADIQGSGSKHSWLEKGKEDAGAQESEEIPDEEIPDEIRKQLRE
ncbi:MAG: hypothetical protein K1X79_10990 [Oligoflexia bacterium]|nr:hypothetical protein [Oligoflexia bacterium]